MHVEWPFSYYTASTDIKVNYCGSLRQVGRAIDDDFEICNPHVELYETVIMLFYHRSLDFISLKDGELNFKYHK